MKTMYKNIGIAFIMLLSFILTSSCKKYLDKKSNKSLVIPSTLSDLQALLDGTAVMNQQSTPTYGEASSDGYFIKDVDYNSLAVTYKAVYTWIYYPFQFGAEDWSYCYQPVYNANLSLDLLKNISRNNKNEDAWDNVKGSALFFRSYYFLCLLWNYAKVYDSITASKDLGVALRLTSDFNVPTVRADNQACYQQVINDTKAAVSLLPAYPQHVMRPSKGAAYGLLARCYLSMRDYKNALLYSDSCLQLNHQLINYNDDPDVPKGITASYSFKQFNKETVFYTELDGKYSIYYSSKSRTDTVLYNAYDNNDLRKQAFYKLNADGYYQFKGSYSGSNVCFSGIATDEMYLTRAECYVRSGEMQKGLNDLDTLLAKRYKSGTITPVMANSLSEALDKILRERQKELELRGLRWMDIKRLNKEGRNIVLKRIVNGREYTLLPNANFYALPLPSDIVQQTGMPQNEL